MNNSLLQSALLKKFSDKIITSVVTEAFYRGLPFDRDDIKHNTQDIVNYASTIMEAMGPTEMLNNALQKNPEDPFLNNFAADVFDIAKIASKRCAMEAAQTVKSMDEIVDQSDFTQEELNSLKVKGIKLDTKTIGEIINKKVIDVIKFEKQEYEETEALKEKLNDTITSLISDDKDEEPALDDELGEGDDNPEDESSIDSYINTYLGPDAVKNHISLFSAIQSRALETLITSNPLYLDEIPMETITLLANEAMEMDNKCDFVGIMHGLEKLKAMQCKTDRTHINENDLNNATVSAILFYTFLETLNTLKIHKPSKEEIIGYCETKTSPEVNFKHKADNLNDNLLLYLKKINLEYNNYDNDTLEETINQLKEIKTSIEELNNSFEKLYPVAFKNLCDLIDRITKFNLDRLNSNMDIKKPAMDTDMGAFESNNIVPPELSYFDSVARESNIAEFNKMARYAKRDTVSSIVIEAALDKNPIVEFRNYAGTIVGRHELKFKKPELYTDMIEAATEAALNSDIIYSNKIMKLKVNGKEKDLL